MTRKILPAPIIAILILWLVPATASAADNWVEVRSPHFCVSSNAGEKDARKVAYQFEQIRQMFHSAFGAMRVDPPQPIIIIAAKNESTTKLYLPEDWEVKGHIHHSGSYQPGRDKDYVILRLNTEGTNPFHTLYHEYTHALMRLNFNRLPLWLSEGLADFFGNSTLGDKEIRTGSIDPSHLYILSQHKLIPIETLLQVDHNSPYYNESDRASVFYAESWAVVHYLMMDPEARQKQSLKNFLDSFNKSGDQVAAATETFGDLKTFGQKIESYARQTTFQVGLVKAGKESADTNYPTRPLSGGEVLALRGDFYTHHNRVEQAKPILAEALKNEPGLALAHEAMGFYYYQRQETKQADEEFVTAMKLGSTGFAPLYFHGFLLLHGANASEDSQQEARSTLEKAIKINPQFAPAYEILSRAYPHTPEGQKLAANAAIKAVQLDPAALEYSINLTYLLINNDRDSDARIMIKRILAMASSPEEKALASRIQSDLQQHEEWAATRKQDARLAARSQSSGGLTDDTTDAQPAGENLEESQKDTVHLKRRALEIDGRISDADCEGKPEITINLALPKGPVTFHAADFRKVSLSWADGVPEPLLANCGKWKGRQVKLWFSPTFGKDYAGEITKLYFF